MTFDGVINAHGLTEKDVNNKSKEELIVHMENELTIYTKKRGLFGPLFYS